MGEPGPHPEPAPPYGLDDLVAHEKRNMRLILVVFVVAVAWYAARGRTTPIGGTSPAPAAPAPVVSGG